MSFDAVTIEIKGTAYPMAFGYGAFRTMGRLWHCKGIEETMQRLAKLEQIKDGLTFEQEDIIADIVLSAIAHNGFDGELPTQDAIIEAVVENPTVLEEVTTALIESLPQAGNPKAATKAAPKDKK